jgi:hypothetical protein
MAISFEESYLPDLLEKYLYFVKEEEEAKNNIVPAGDPNSIGGPSLVASAGGRALTKHSLSKSMPELNSKFSTLRNVIGTEDIFKAFINFCIKCKGHENACFYMEAKIFESSIYPHSVMLAEVNRIIDYYIRSGAQMQINIDSEIRNAIMNHSKAQTIDSTIFVKARKEIYSLMSCDLFTKWKSSRDFDRIKDYFKDS